jgi:hypothetical protein
MKKLGTAILIFLLLVSISWSALAQENAALDSKLTSAIDLRVPAGAISLQLQRRLETGRTQRGLLGTRWRLNWNRSCVRSIVHRSPLEMNQWHPDTISLRRTKLSSAKSSATCT